MHVSLMAGYDRHRSRSEIIAGLRKPPTKTSKAHLQSIEAVRQYLDDNFALAKICKSRSNNPSLKRPIGLAAPE